MKIDNRIWVILTVLVSGALLAGAWFLGVSPFLAAAGTSAMSAAQVSQTNAQTRTAIAALKAKRAQLPTLEAELSALKRAVPSSVEGSTLITEVDAISAASGAKVTNITLGAPVAYTSPAPAATTTPATGTSSTASPSPTASATATPAPVPTGPAAPTVVTDGSITGQNFLVVPVTVTVKGAAAQTAAFLHGLQYGDRLVLVSVLQRSTDTDGVTLLITGSAYVIDDSSAATTTTTATAGTNG